MCSTGSLSRPPWVARPGGERLSILQQFDVGEVTPGYSKRTQRNLYATTLSTGRFPAPATYRFSSFSIPRGVGNSRIRRRRRRRPLTWRKWHRSGRVRSVGSLAWLGPEPALIKVRFWNMHSTFVEICFHFPPRSDFRWRSPGNAMRWRDVYFRKGLVLR